MHYTHTAQKYNYLPRKAVTDYYQMYFCYYKFLSDFYLKIKMLVELLDILLSDDTV